MAKCKLCRIQIADGTEYCDDCAKKKDLIVKESYLDELLNSVQGQGTTASDIYKKKKENQKDDSPEVVVPQNESESSLIDPQDIEDFENYDLMKEFDDTIVINEEDLDKATEQVDSNIDDLTPEVDEPEEQIGNEDDYIEPAVEDLLKHLDMTEDDILGSTTPVDGNDLSDEVASSAGDTSSDVPDEADIDSLISQLDFGNNGISADNDLFDLLHHINPDDQEVDDIKVITDLLGEKKVEGDLSKDYPGDIGEVFSKTLEAVSDLSDDDLDLKFMTPDIDSGDKKDAKGVKDKKGKKGKKEAKEKKEGLFTKLFANIEDEDIAPDKKKAKEEVSGAKNKKKKQSKKKKGGELPVANMDDVEEIPVRRRQAGAAEEVKKETKQKKKKKEKKEKKKIEILDDYVDEGKINKAGASIVFLFFGILVLFVLIATNIFSYSLSIKNANDYFDKQKYTKAYNEVYGIEIKDEDIGLYDKIMTVMFVNKQLNSYNSYYQMKKYPEALDSLLKGLQRYDKYIELATMLGIKTDLDYVRNQIIAELYNVFNITEEQALRIINSENQTEYSIAIYDVVLENAFFYN